MELSRSIDTFDNVEDLTITSDEKWAVVGGASGATMYETATGKAVHLPTGSVTSLDISPDGRRLVTAGNGVIRFWDMSSLSHVGELDMGRKVTAVRFLDDDQLLYVVADVGAGVLDAGVTRNRDH